jgi:hypothetical protein
MAVSFGGRGLVIREKTNKGPEAFSEPEYGADDWI